MSSGIRTAVRYLHHCRTTGVEDAERRRKEEQETERIRAGRGGRPKLTPEQRQAQENAKWTKARRKRNGKRQCKA